MSGADIERLLAEIPGPRSAALATLLRTYESRNVTFLAEDFPIFWESASGATVRDVDGSRYIDLTAAFGVANVGHCNSRVVHAIADQAKRLMHGMGDVYPTAIRVRLFERLAEILPKQLNKTYLASTGSDAIEAALKSAILATGKTGFAAYRGAYHGLSFGALAVGGIDRFRNRFAGALPSEPLLLHYPRAGDGLDAQQSARDARGVLAAGQDIAALVIEPVQGRGGCIVPPSGYLTALRAVCDELQIVMIVDEIYTGFGRTGTWFAIDREHVVPDILCIGKAMGSGFPISAAVGRAQIMDAWPLSTGEALHTSTHLGNPLGCAAALATIDELKRLELPARAERLGRKLGPRLEALRAHRSVVDVRGRGLLWALQLRDAAVTAAVVRRSLTKGVILLQSGVDGNAITIAPPLVIGERLLARAIDILEIAIQEADEGES